MIASLESAIDSLGTIRAQSAIDSLRTIRDQAALDSLAALRNQSALDSLRARIPSATGASDSLGMLVQTVIYLGLVAIVVYVILRWGAPRLLGGRLQGKGSMKLVERLPLGGNRSICIVQVEGRKYLVGITDHDIRTLDVLDGPARQEDSTE
ncbi:MAG: flagellar biosynthetic protein FliO [Candidatus Eisenbacteria bacterium]|uniref:Flagellar protein n=1 Tax=Eiseniibacteriota bacterium TaxID=2212470 RepID=A0A956SEZ7_UNCEI|nr:flagellar biosynthetic protein FliO [Candidatus Eisenbacteria bacterium]MCB9463964.1 flagellar biosynthetic protein FliO [Candidatus Eisenbacteria bacterium]